MVGLFLRPHGGRSFSGELGKELARLNEILLLGILESAFISNLRLRLTHQPLLSGWTTTQFQNIKRLTGSQAFFRDFLSPKPKIFLGLGPRHLIGRSIFF